MKWSIQELRKIKEKQLSFDTTLDLKENLMSRDSEIMDLSPVHVTGQLLIEPHDYLVLAHVSCQVTLPSTRSLEPVDVPLSFDFDEMYMTEEQNINRPESLQDELIMVLDKETIDLEAAVADNILLNFPIQVLTEEEQTSNEMPKGQGWEVISEDEFIARHQKEQQNTVDPRLSKLSELLKDD